MEDENDKEVRNSGIIFYTKSYNYFVLKDRR